MNMAVKHPLTALPLPANEAIPAARALSPAKASAFAYNVLAHTDRIGGTVYDTKYATEVLLVDPIAEIEDDCLVVTIFKGGSPFMCRCTRPGKDQNGRFIAKGDPKEAYRLHFGVTFTKADLGRSIFYLGRVVGEPRQFPRA